MSKEAPEQQPGGHAGTWDYHDDDCMCPIAGRYCNRDGHVWSCCGATQQDSRCSAPTMHPTYWDYPPRK